MHEKLEKVIVPTFDVRNKKKYFGAFKIRDFVKQDGMNRTQVQGEKHL